MIRYEPTPGSKPKRERKAASPKAIAKSKKARTAKAKGRKRQS